MELNTVIKKRKSIRSFKRKNVNWRRAIDAIEAAIQNPFAGNINNIKYIIIEEKETIKEISKLAEQVWISESPLLIIICSDDSKLEDLYGERGRIYSKQQAGAVIQTILLKLTDMKIDSCWVGAYTDEILKQKLNIPQHIQVEAIIPIGYSDKKPGDKKPVKNSIESVLKWEDWKTDKRHTIIKEAKDPYALRN